MKKEIGIAIVIGFILGLIITFGIWTANKSLKENASTQQKEENIQNVTSNQEKSPTTEEKMTLKILSPENNALVSDTKVKITGKTLPNINVVVLGEESENFLQTDEQGQFTQEITLVGGTNEIKISAFDNDGAQANVNLNLVYSKSEI